MVFLHRIKKIKHKEESSLQQKGSLTVESAFVLPFFFLAAAMMAGMLDLFRTTVLIQTSLCEGAKELGMYAYCGAEDTNSPVGMVNQSICAAYGTKKVRDELKGESLSGVAGGINGIILLGSRYEKEIISLKAVFYYRIPIALFQTLPLKIQVVGQARAWKGYQGECYDSGEEEEMVYITQWESVYHEAETCTHLNLSVEKIPYSSVGEKVNTYGEKYHACEKCVGNGTAGSWVYITDTGNCYHNSAACSGLTRHVKLVKKSETEHLKACERCEGKSE